MEVEIELLLEGWPADLVGTSIKTAHAVMPKCSTNYRPVVVFELGDQALLLADRYHRVAAAQLAGCTTVQADVRVGTKEHAAQFAIDVARAEWGVSADQARGAIRHYSRWSEQ